MVWLKNEAEGGAGKKGDRTPFRVYEIAGADRPGGAARGTRLEVGGWEEGLEEGELAVDVATTLLSASFDVCSSSPCLPSPPCHFPFPICKPGEEKKDEVKGREKYIRMMQPKHGIKRRRPRRTHVSRIHRVVHHVVRRFDRPLAVPPRVAIRIVGERIETVELRERRVHAAAQRGELRAQIGFESGVVGDVDAGGGAIGFADGGRG